MNTLDLLIKARDLISSPEKWTQKCLARDCDDDDCYYGSDRAAKFCSVGAINRIVFRDLAFDGLHADSIRELRSSAAFELELVMKTKISDYNDYHNHAEVLAKFDLAIANAQTSITGP